MVFLLGTMADEIQRVRAIFNAACIDETVIVHMVDVLQIVTVTDFVNYVEHSKSEAELGSSHIRNPST